MFSWVRIQELKPCTYTYDPVAILASTGRADSTLAHDNLAQAGASRYTGFLAQEVEEAARAIGFDFSAVDNPKNEGDLYGLRYAEFVVPL